MPGDIGGFLLIHFPLFILGLYGVVLVWQGALAGLIISLIVSLAGVFAFGVHTYFIRRGSPEFRTPISQSILRATLIMSLAQAGMTIYQMAR